MYEILYWVSTTCVNHKRVVNQTKAISIEEWQAHLGQANFFKNEKPSFPQIDCQILSFKEGVRMRAPDLVASFVLLARRLTTQVDCRSKIGQD